MEEKRDETIKVYLRMRPNAKKTDHIKTIKEKHLVELYPPRNLESGYINNSKTSYLFKFDEIYGTESKQEEIFEGVAKEVIDSALEGYNGTIFAYGQTGSGKTYTITGGAERMSDRGVIPRALSYVFNETKQRSNHKWKVYVSYLEIYNNDGFDLLHETQGRATALEELPRVRIRENLNKQLVLSNLSVHQVDNEEEAMLLLMLGDENRVVAETPKNDASTRSHCIFMIQVESQKIGEDTKTLSKLHIVDLSGSEKPYKTELNGVRMNEALNINLSLHFLEQVIVSLNKKDGHIPYRNSMMTMCLRDSLGGNCKTRMIATMSSDLTDVLESLSTCRFAQRVALIKNSAIKNEIEDPALVIQKQKSEIEGLKDELALLKGKDQKSVLEEEDLVNCKKIVEEFLSDDDYSRQINLRDMLMIQECFSIIKVKYKDLEKKAESGAGEVVLDANFSKDKLIELENKNKKLTAEVERLRDLLKRREEEMKVLLDVIDRNAGGERNKTLLTHFKEEDKQVEKVKNNILGDLIDFGEGKRQDNREKSLISEPNASKTKIETTLRDSSIKGRAPMSLLQEINTANSLTSKSIELNRDTLASDKKAYAEFKPFYIKESVLQENLKLLQQKFESGKEIGKQFVKLKENLLGIKEEIERVRKLKIVNNVDDAREPNNEYKQKEEQLLLAYTEMKTEERQKYKTLESMKQEINSMQALIDATNAKRAKDFKFWYEVMVKKYRWEQENGPIGSTGGSSSNPNTSSASLSRVSERSADLKDIKDKLNSTRRLIDSDLGR